jgi:hypothetical protein
MRKFWVQESRRKLTDIEFETITEKCRANFIGNQQTDVITLKKYVANVTGARGVQWLNGVPSDDYMKGLINRLKSCGIQFVLTTLWVVQRLRLELQQIHLSTSLPSLKHVKFTMISFLRSKAEVSIIQHAGLCSTRSVTPVSERHAEFHLGLVRNL